jgi:hypothetical protein
MIHGDLSQKFHFDLKCMKILFLARRAIALRKRVEGVLCFESFANIG